MPYEHRFGCTTKRPKDYRHDPAHTGIFIHGGTCDAGPFRNRNGANNFGITLPGTAPTGKELNLSALVSTNFKARARTFQQAVDHAKVLRSCIPDLAACDIYACTDLLMDTTYSGKYEVQRVA